MELSSGFVGDHGAFQHSERSCEGVEMITRRKESVGAAPDADPTVPPNTTVDHVASEAKLAQSVGGHDATV
jgi:hypothetical protein